MQSPDLIYKKRASKKCFLVLILEKKFFSHKYIILATVRGEQSKLLVFSSASFFTCSSCFDFSYQLSPARVSLDCATLGHHINLWKLALQQLKTQITKKIFKCELSFKKLQKHIFASDIKIAWYQMFSIVYVLQSCVKWEEFLIKIDLSKGKN